MACAYCATAQASADHAMNPCPVLRREMERYSGRKDDAAKPRWDLLPFDALDLVAKVLAHGVEKYGPDNWRNVSDGSNRYFAAALRHLSAWRQGERNDTESGLPHLAHAACCVLFMLALDNDDGEMTA